MIVRFRHAALVALVQLAVMAGRASTLSAQSSTAVPAPAQSAAAVGRTGADVYRAACLTCHGSDGRGSPRTVVGFDVPLPDFTDCAFATGEPNPDWYAVVHEGGPIRGLDHHMPAFGSALSPTEIDLAIGHLRTFCKEPAWPRGDLNFPKAFFTEKAFPENEAVWTTTFTGSGEKTVGTTAVYERRLGARNQFELVVPLEFQLDGSGASTGGFGGDLAIAFKRALYASTGTGRIAAAGVEVILPTSKDALGIGSGYTLFEPFAMWGQALPRNSFLQMHGGVEIPSDSARGRREVYLRTAVGTSFAQNRGFGRVWSPQVEVLWARPQGGSSEWDIVPQLQITLSKLQHVMVAGGVRIPVSDRGQRRAQAVMYLLWDWFDGGFFEFWK